MSPGKIVFGVVPSKNDKRCPGEVVCFCFACPQ